MTPELKTAIAISGAARRPNILVVDDQASNIRLMHQLLSGKYDVFMATSGVAALEFCRNSPPDLVLLDVVMDGMDGLAVCRNLQADMETSNIPVIFVTANTDVEGENACWHAGGVDFVTKPVNALTLLHRVNAHLQLKFQTDALRKMALMDGLTGVANRRHFDERFEAEWRRCGRNGAPLGLVMVDVDHFKRYNDTYGHVQGDDCLRQVASAIRSCLNRSCDLVARFGGEEFVCLLPETDASGTFTAANRILAAVQTAAIAHAASDTAPVVTVSIGGAVVCPTREPGANVLLTQADAALYRAKHSGRAQVCMDQ